MSKPVKDLAITAVVPVHNEEGNVASLAREIKAVSVACNIKAMIFVDDHSNDGTLKVLSDLKGEIKSLRIVHHKNQCGQSAAVFSGIKAADTAWVVTMDGDGQNNPCDIPQMVAALKNADSENVRLVNGNRNKKNNRKDTFVKRYSSKIANAVRSRMLKDNIPDSGCGLKLMHRETFLSLPYFANMHRFIPALFIRTGSQIISVDVSHRNRASGQSHYGLFNRLWIGIIDLLGVTWLMNKGYRAISEEVDPH